MTKLTSKELDVYRGILSDLNDGVPLGYNELINELLINFGIKTTKKELSQLDCPTYVDDSIDLKILYRNIT